MGTLCGTYGGNQTPCQVFTYEQSGGTWYVCEDSQNVNFTYADLDHIQNEHHAVDVELLEDVATFTAANPIHSELELETAVNS